MKLVSIFNTMIVILLSGCTGLTEIITSQKEDAIWTGPGANIDDDDRTICYVSGIDYPEGYDWSGAGAEDNVRCSLVVFANGAPMLKLPVGKGYEVSAEPDMHRLIDGHIYTLFCSEGYTSIKKDGKACIRYEGCESVRDMLVVDNDIYTLGIPQEGKGFTYRKNGEIILERRTGVAFERLNLDSGRICFAFRQSATVSGGSYDRYYIVRDGRSALLDLPEEKSQVWDIMSHGGRTCALISAGPWSTLEVLRDDERESISLPGDAEMITCRLFTVGEEIGIEGLYSYGSGTFGSGLWVEGEEYMLFETGQPISAISTSDKEICCILNPEQDNHSGIIFKSGKTHTMPHGYTFTGNSPIDIDEGRLYVGLTSLKGSRPIIWKEGKTDTLNLNGPLCSLSIKASLQ